LSVPARLDDDPSLVSKGPHDNMMAGGPPRRGWWCARPAGLLRGSHGNT